MDMSEMRDHSLWEDVQLWREVAAEMRMAGELMHDVVGRAIAKRIANDFERLAQLEERAAQFLFN